MKYLPHIIIACILMAIAFAIYKDNEQHIPKQDYTLDMYTDTICGYVIITTIANNGNNIGVSSIIVNNTSEKITIQK